jgi:uncharacterized membrane protein YdjX (TVP38/TMEM64 family)
MKQSATTKKHHKRSLINLVGLLLLIFAAICVVLLFYMRTPQLQAIYEQIQGRISELETHVETFILGLSGNVWLVMLAFVGIYILKCAIPIVPLSLLCVMSAAILPTYICLPLNILGVLLWVSIRYFWGKRRGGGSIHKLLSHANSVSAFIERDGKGNPWLLFVFRVVPSFPVNSVSQIYGALGFDFTDFTLISLLGFLPKLVSYIFIGSNAFHPFTSSFLVPLIIVFTLSGISVITINCILFSAEKKESHDSKSKIAPKGNRPHD